MEKIKILKIQIRSAQNVGKVFLSRKNIFPAPFGAFPGYFLRGPENPKDIKILLIFLGGPMGPIHLVGVPLLSFCYFVFAIRGRVCRLQNMQKKIAAEGAKKEKMFDQYHGTPLRARR